MVYEGQKVIERSWVMLHHETYAEIMKGETAHDHKVIEDECGTYRWEAFPEREKEIMQFFGVQVGELNELVDAWHRLASYQKHTGILVMKNDPLIRQLYRCMGYSLSGYHEVFYWDVNNEDKYEWVADYDVNSMYDQLIRFDGHMQSPVQSNILLKTTFDS